MKRYLALFLSLVTVLSLMGTASASVNRWDAEDCAWALYHMDLFRGKGVDGRGDPIFALDVKATRAEGATMLVRLLGAEEEALAGKWNCPFTDVPDWAAPYVGYAYEKGLTNGTSTTTFSPNEKITGTQYATFVLRAMGYESGAEFQWDNAWPMMVKAGVLEEGLYSNKVDFDRGDAAIVSYLALFNGKMKQGGTLGEKLAEKGVVKPVGQQCSWTQKGYDNGSGSYLFSFEAEKDSPAAYVRFTVDKATVNGVACEVIPIDTPEKVKQHAVDMNEKYGTNDSFAPGTFGIAYLYYDEAAALAAAEKTTVGGVSRPMMIWRIWATGELADGTVVKEFGVVPYYLAGGR